MKKRKLKIGMLVLTALLLVGMAQVGLAGPLEGTGTKIRETCQGIWDNFTPEQQEEVEAAREEFRNMKEELHEAYPAPRGELQEEFQSRKAELREALLEAMPAELREQLQEKMEARHGNHNGERMQIRQEKLTGERKGGGAGPSER